MFEVSYRKNWRGTIKVWKFEEPSVARRFYRDAVKSLKDANTVVRLPGDGTLFHIRGEPKKSGGYETGAQFTFRRTANEIILGWVNPDRKTAWRSSHYLPFESVFQSSSNEVKKTLAFHFDIFA